MSRATRRARLRATRRPLLVLFLVLGLGALALLSFETRSTTSQAPESLGPTAIAQDSAESSAFTCGGLSEGSTSALAGDVVLTNASSQVRTASLQVFDDVGHSAHLEKTVPGGTSVSVPVSSLLSGGSDVATSVVIDGGGVGVSEETTAPAQTTLTPCASTVASWWGFAGGSTLDTYALSYHIVNPTATSAVVDVNFSTPSGLVIPQGSQGLVVAPFGVVTVAASKLVPHISVLGGEVTATKGAVVAFASQVSPNPKGVALILGQDAPAASLVLSGGASPLNTSTSIVLFNPTSGAQTVTVRPRIASGSLAPWTQAVAPYATASLQVAPTTRIPLTARFSASVTSSGNGVVATYWTMATSAASSGLGAVPLVREPDTARSWLLTPSRGAAPVRLTLTATSSSPVVVHVSLVTPEGLVPLAGFDGVDVTQSRPLTATTAELASIGQRALVVSSSGPLAVAEDVAGGAVLGTALQTGMPVTGP